MSNRVKEKCDICGIETDFNRSTVYKVRKDGRPLRCKKCHSKHLSDISKDRENNMTDEQKQYRSKLCSEKKKEWWLNMTPEQKESISKQQSISQKKRFENPLEIKKYSEAAKQRLSNLTEEDRIERSKKISVGGKKRYANMNEEQRQKQRDVIKAGYENMSDEAKLRKSQRQSEINHKRFSDPKERERISEMFKQYWSLPDSKEKASKIQKEWWKNISDDLRNKILDALNKGHDNWWINLSNDGRIEFMNNIRPIDIPTVTELEFMNILNILNIQYEYNWESQIEHPDFYTKFPINPVRGGWISYKHHWDFNIHTINGNILIDIDGSMHYLNYETDGVNIGEVIRFNDSQRPYQTDGLPAYIIECPDDKLNDDCTVINVTTGDKMNLKQLKSLISFMNIPGKDQKSIINKEWS